MDDLAIPPTLTTAERAVAVSLVRGLSMRAIADIRGTSPRTIANQARAIYRKLKINSRLELGTLILKRADCDAWRERIECALDARERAVLILRARANAVKVIAYELGMSPATVSRTLARAMHKLGLESMSDVVRVCGSTASTRT
jgi:DNA-binding NarL/FixJ family response regulator